MDHDSIKDEIANLVRDGYKIIIDENGAHKSNRTGTRVINIDPTSKSVESRYQHFLNLSCSILRAVRPDRLDEFMSLYTPNIRRRGITYLTYTISDYWKGVSLHHGDSSLVDSFNCFVSGIKTQIHILEGVQSSLGERIINIQRLLEADLYDGELESARGLLKAGFARVAGVVAGVILENHLKSVCFARQYKFTKKHIALSDLNERLKAEEVIDIPKWRLIQWLGDIRNLCAHQSEREASLVEVNDLISGVSQTITTVF